jgi:hypothetical protein
MTQTFGRNGPCPCGSGLKLKKCCKLVPAATRFTARDREALFGAADAFIEEQLFHEEEAAYEQFWSAYHGRESELEPELLRFSHEAQQIWFLCDYELEPGRTALDLLCERPARLSLGAHAFAQALRRSRLRVYEVMHTVPGVSITLMDVAQSCTITVAERLGSTVVQPSEWLAARVLARGVSGKPEIDLGVLPVPPFYRGEVFTKLADLEDACQPGQDPCSHPDFPPFIHQLWVRSMLEPHGWAEDDGGYLPAEQSQR